MTVEGYKETPEGEPNFTLRTNTIARERIPEAGIPLRESRQFGRVLEALQEIAGQDQAAVIVRFSAAGQVQVIDEDDMVYPGDVVDVSLAVSNG